jgi:hypothetical protein
MGSEVTAVHAVAGPVRLHEQEVGAMIALEDAERGGRRLARSHDHGPRMIADGELLSTGAGEASWAADYTILYADGRCADDEWSYDLFDLQDTGLVPLY